MTDEQIGLVGREFRHFKGNRYRLEGFAKDSETLEEMVVYRALYGDGGLWVRPAKMFFETIEDAIRREVREEASIEVKDIRYFGSQTWPFPSNIMIGFRAEYAGGELTPDGEEVVESGWFDREHLPEIPRHGSIARAMLDAWVAESRKGTQK